MMRSSSDTKNSSLIYCSAGERLTTLPWIPVPEGFDIALAYYGDENICAPGVKYFIKNKDFKIPNFILMAREYPEIMEYQHYYFIDDDIIISAETFAQWCMYVKNFDLDISQPSLTPDSKMTWPHLGNQPALDVDFGQFVEVQCFCLSRKAMKLALPFFFMAKTGTGLDVAIYHLAGRHQLRSGVIHKLIVFHPFRPNQNTVRQQFADFGVFNAQLSRFISFCFSDNVTFKDLARASRVTGNTSISVARGFAVMRFLLDRIRRVAKRFTKQPTRTQR